MWLSILVIIDLWWRSSWSGCMQCSGHCVRVHRWEVGWWIGSSRVKIVAILILIAFAPLVGRDMKWAIIFVWESFPFAIQGLFWMLIVTTWAGLVLMVGTWVPSRRWLFFWIYIPSLSPMGIHLMLFVNHIGLNDLKWALVEALAAVDKVCPLMQRHRKVEDALELLRWESVRFRCTRKLWQQKVGLLESIKEQWYCQSIVFLCSL